MIVRTEALTKRFGPISAVEDLTLDVPAGVTGLVGANGAGKTTLIRMLLGLTHPTSGRIEVCDVDVAADPTTVRTFVGFMPEHDCLPGDQSAADVVATLAELAGLPARDARQRASDVLDLVGLDEARFRPVAGFSTGMRQRAKLAQALVADPRLVLLDEPTAGLDPLGREDMLALIRRLGSFGISVLVSTHLLDDVEATCDHVVMLDGGRLVESGATAQLVAGSADLDVETGRGASDASAALTAAGLMATAHGEATLTVTDVPNDAGPRIAAVLADLGLPLFRMTRRRRSLDDVFLERATPQS